MTKPITALPGVGDARAQDLHRLGFRTLADIANATPEALCAVPGFRTHRALQLITAARALLAEEGTPPAAKTRRRSANAATPSSAAPPFQAGPDQRADRDGELLLRLARSTPDPRRPDRAQEGPGAPCHKDSGHIRPRPGA
mgnify:CR=1 FL=1